MAKIDYDWDIIIIARDTWGDVWRRRHFLASEWSKRHKVLFVEQPFSVSGWLSGREKSDFRGIFRGQAGPREVEDNIFALRPMKILPNSMPGFRPVNMAAHRAAIAGASRRLGLKKPVMWITPEYGVHFLRGVEYSLAVYDVTDDWPLATLPRVERRQIVSDDRALLRRADMVVTVSKYLHEKKSPKNPNTLLVPNGVRVELYEKTPPVPEELASIPGPRVGYVGSLHSDRLDVDMIVEVARLGRGKYSQVFVGPDSLNEGARKKLIDEENIFLLPPVDFRRLPALVCNFDICSIPHDLNPFTHSLDPIKAYEYLASGKPIISTPVQGILPLADYVTIAESPEEYHSSIQEILSGKEKSSPDERRRAALDHSWARRAEHIENLVQQAFDRKNA